MMQLQFLNKHNSNSPAIIQAKTLEIRPYSSNNIPRQFVRNPNVPPSTTTYNNVQSKPKTMTWGQPTWYLFHTLAQKVHEDTFPEIRQELLTIISTICNNLPCPDCANHATQYMNSLNMNVIQTKRDLINMLFQFHNTVNARKHFQQFSYAELESKYSSANTVNIIQYFIQVFSKPNYSGRVSVNNFHKTRFIAQLKAFFSTKLTYFDP
jgi:hypothetical protein